MIALVNMLYDQKNYILICTARGTSSKINHRHLTVTQLKKWGVKYHKLVFGNIISDKVITPEEFLNEV
jgi:dethiobiotin synthetase